MENINRPGTWRGIQGGGYREGDTWRGVQGGGDRIQVME